MPGLPIALALILSFLLVTLIMSAHEKISNWETSKKFYISLYRKILPCWFILGCITIIVLLEILLTVLLGFSIYDLGYSHDFKYVNYALVGCAVFFVILLFGLRLIKDYAGASRIGIYFLVTICGLIVQSINTMVLQHTINFSN
ncbi:MAG: hypothetical protein NWQ09_03375 [Nonlabens sp.]|nr:hypothetical protein [Nonlabens sp.]